MGNADLKQGYVQSRPKVLSPVKILVGVAYLGINWFDYSIYMTKYEGYPKKEEGLGFPMSYCCPSNCLAWKFEGFKKRCFQTFIEPTCTKIWFLFVESTQMERRKIFWENLMPRKTSIGWKWTHKLPCETISFLIFFGPKSNQLLA